MYERVWNAAKMEQLGGDEQSCFGAIYDFTKRMVADSARGLHGGLKDTSSRPPKDLGGTLRRTSKTTLRSYDSRASGDLLCSHRQGCVANVARIESY